VDYGDITDVNIMHDIRVSTTIVVELSQGENVNSHKKARRIVSRGSCSRIMVSREDSKLERQGNVYDRFTVSFKMSYSYKFIHMKNFYRYMRHLFH